MDRSGQSTSNYNWDILDGEPLCPNAAMSVVQEDYSR